MKKLFAKVKVDGLYTVVEGEYKTKKEFKEELQGNGYTVNKIYDELQWWALDYVVFEKDVFNKDILNQIISEYK